SNGGDGVSCVDTRVSCKSTEVCGNGICGMRTRINDLESRLVSLGLVSVSARSNGASGIDVIGGSVEVRDSTLSGNGAGTGGVGGDGLRAYLVGDTTIYNSAIYECARHGVSIDHGGYVYIIG